MSTEKLTLEEQERVFALAVEGMFEEITIYGERDDGHVRAAGFSKLTEAQALWREEHENGPLEDYSFAEAVDKAVLFYEDEAGGSHDLSHLEGLTTWEVLAGLPTH